MDPHLSGSKIDRQVYHNIYEPLVVLDEKLGIKPGLAESWQQPDPKTLVFKLRQGVKFHDGTDFNAEAVKFNFDRMADRAQVGAQGRGGQHRLGRGGRSRYTVKLNLKQPDAALLATLTDRAGHDGLAQGAAEARRRARAQRQGRGHRALPVRRVGAGRSPAASSATTPTGTSRAGPISTSVRYRPIPGRHGQAAEPAGRRDRRDGLRRSRATWRSVKGDKNLVVVDVPSLAASAYSSTPPSRRSTTRPLRQAVAYALDLEAIVKGVWLSVGVPANGPISPTSWAYDDDDPADQARPRQGQGQAGRGRQAGRLHASR